MKTAKITNDTSFQVKNKQYLSTAKDPNGGKTHADTVQWTQTTSALTMFNFTSSSSDKSPMQKSIPTKNRENGKLNAINNETQILVLKNKGSRSIHTILLSESKSKNWFVAFYTQTQYQGMEAANNCGTRTNPCYYLKTVMSQLKKGDTLILISDLISHHKEVDKHKTDLAVQGTS